MDWSYSNALLVALTPSQECVGIRIFPTPYKINGISYVRYLYNCMAKANELKSKIESGEMTEIETHPNVILNPQVPAQNLSTIKILQHKCKCLLP